MRYNNCFELWIDESGDFLSDISNKRLNPSLVGGVLIEQGIVDETIAGKILNRDFVHFNEENGQLNIEVLRKVAEYKAEFVVFENKERLLVIDSDTTYLNILSEGIIQLLLFLSAKYGDFELNVLVATRKNTTAGKGILSEEEYEKRLKEKVVLGIARNALTKKTRWKYKISFGDARIDKRLMLSDCVCNTYLTRTSRKFTDEDRIIINELYKKELNFSIFESSVDIEIKRAIAEGRFGDVIFELYFNSELAEGKKKYLDLALDRLQQFNDFAINNQLMSITSKIDTLIRMHLDYSVLKVILTELQSELVPLLKQRNMAVPEFILDIILYLYTIYTHEGSAQAEEQDEFFMIELENLTDLFIKFQYFIMYKTRQAIHQKNMLDVEASIDNMTKVIKIMEQMKELMSIIDGAEDNMLGDKNIMLAKAYGTRLQAWAMTMHKEKDDLEKARVDYENALKQFANENDKVRQHLYLSQAECEAGNIENALKLILKTENMNYMEEDSVEKFIDKINGQRLYDVIYKYLAYVRIMSYAKRLKEDSIASYMYKAMTKNNVNLETFKASFSGIHPLEMIYWHMGDYFAYSEEIKKANRYYDMAIELCEQSQRDITIKVIQLGVLSSKVLAYLHKKRINEAKDVVDRLINEYSTLIAGGIPSTVLDYVGILKNVSKENINTEALEEFTVKARAIN
ncbi:hypothetical protein CFOLD11_11690 [Clostridium folliculivorans]|uniref:Uncharacterized protein n=1 Tax=Clostridium folliculivorans TaxID=2886038 RepID=A0A9W5Y0F3_9CLOT|nr:hypothetical protein [Clostridium folliculivorans]GKU24343.1 hypothetical protein CFOLD11_11690 [Clostridium folliculivorans]